MSATMCDYHVLKKLDGESADAGTGLSPNNELVLNFNPPNDIVLSGDKVHKPILSFRLYMAATEDHKTTSRVTVKVGNTKVFDGTKFQSGYTTIYEALNFSNLRTGNQQIKITTDSFGSISDVIMWYKRN